MNVTLRPAVSEDAPAIARICLAAGGGSFEYLFNGLQSGLNAESILTTLAALDSTPYTYRNFTLAEVDGTVAGGVNAFSIPDLTKAEESTLPSLVRAAKLRAWALVRFGLRRIRLGRRLRGKVPSLDTFILANVAVFPDYAGHGIGTQLVQHVVDRAADEGYPSVSLVVWGSNARARALYERLGFVLADEGPFKPLRHLPYTSRCLMVHDLSRRV